LARGDSDGAPDAEADGLDDGDDAGLLPLEGDGLDGEPPPDPLPEGPSEAPPDPSPFEGEVVGEDGELVGAEDGDEVGDGEAAITGGATAGGAALPLPCFHAQPTEPPAGTVREPALYDE
jgi:hypothetical protein